MQTSRALQKPPRNFVPEPFYYGQEIELEIHDLTNLGDGVGRHDGWVVFVPYALPGERVRVRIWRNKKQYSDADLVEVLQATPDRVQPVCPLFGDCGGCQYQHYAYSAQLIWKQKQIAQLLRKMAALEVPVNPCMGDAVHTYGYRSKITPHFRRPPDLPDVAIGFQRAASRSVLDVPQCPIASPSINVALRQQRELLRTGQRRYKRGGTLLLRDSIGGVVTEMHARATEQVGSFTFGFVAGEFFQNNPHMLPKMVDYALDQAAVGGIRYLVDAYCGVGVFAICGHARFEAVTGVEVNEQAILLANENLVRNRVANVRFLLNSAETVFAGLGYPPEQTCVLLDPPRKGCDPVFIDQLTAYRPARIVYVSCGPDTQARDLRIMVAGGYQVIDVQPVDLFPQTRHIENIVTLTLA